MANLTDTAASWEAGVYQIETTDPVVGGEPNPSTGAGMSNIPHLQLAKRTAWLKGQVEALQNAGGYKSALTFTGNQTLTAADAGKCYIYGETTAVTLTLPLIVDTPVGSIFEFINTGTANMTVQRAGSNEIDSGPTSVTSIVIPPNQSLKLIRATGSSLWHPVSVTAAGLTTSFGSSLAANGWQRLPSGLIIQWGAFLWAQGVQIVSLPISFPNSFFSITATSNSGATANQAGYFVTLDSNNLSSFKAGNWASSSVYAPTGVSVGYIALGR